MPKSWGWELPGKILFSSTFGFEDNFVLLSSKLPEASEFSMSWNLIWLSAWIFDNLLDNLSNLKLISSNLLVSCLNWSSTSDNFNKCLVNTSSEFESSSKLELLLFDVKFSIEPE